MPNFSFFTSCNQFWPKPNQTHLPNHPINIPKTSKSNLERLLLLLMNLLFFVVFLFFTYGFSSEPGVGIGYQLMVAVPVIYDSDFKGRGFLVETNHTTTKPNFRVALSIDPFNGRYTCSLQVFLGDVKVWDSGHYSRFFTTEKCLLDITMDGDLMLKGPKEHVGWKTGTSGQGVKQRLEIQKTGNLVLVDAMNNIKWQSFNFPTDVMLEGQVLDVATRLTSFQSNSSLFYSFEIEENRVALYLNSGNLRYSYWHFQPSMNRSISYVKLISTGLALFNVKYKKIAEIQSNRIHPLSFLALKNDTGNFGLYYYSPEKANFQASFQALNSTCDLPIACRPYGICTFSNSCSCIQILSKDDSEISSDCSSAVSGSFCDGKQAEIIELDNVSSVLKGVPKMVKISKEECGNLCLEDCKCASALYFRNASTNVEECYIYRLVLGLKQVDKGTGFSYMVKVPKGSGRNHEKHNNNNVKRWVLILVGVVDGVIILVIVGGFGYWLVKRRTHTIHSQATAS
ncbi:PAN domain-containing protein At5g03700 isoform X1 [Arachis ipaensis]|uniref:PAN domain-containing protein At5g03700 isoform X1 n=1 Tax=Arachis ipaensis TaxID=130454 RepID=UPI000A2AFCD0|nr:PAN domain-containing protein At5g03700 isoform X1 [Arachis ipaensis]